MVVVEGMVIPVRDVQPLKASFPMDVTPVKDTEVKDVQPLNAPSGMVVIFPKEETLVTDCPANTVPIVGASLEEMVRSNDFTTSDDFVV